MEKRAIKSAVCFLLWEFIYNIPNFWVLVKAQSPVTEARMLINKQKPNSLWESMLHLSFKIPHYTSLKLPWHRAEAQTSKVSYRAPENKMMKYINCIKYSLLMFVTKRTNLLIADKKDLKIMNFILKKNFHIIPPLSFDLEVFNC